MSDIRQRLLAAFQQEQQEHVGRLRGFLDELDRPEGPSPAEYQQAMRAAHTLKGAARAVDLSVLESIAHRLESVLAGLQKAEIEPEQALAVLRQVVDAVEDYAGRPDVETREPPAECLGLLAGLLPAAVAPAAPPAEDRTPAMPPVAPAARAPEPSVRVDASTLEALSATVGELVGEARRQKETGNLLEGLALRMEVLEQAWGRARRESLREDPAGVRQRGFYSGLEEEFHLCLGEMRRLKSRRARDQTALRGLCEALRSQVRAARMIPAADVLGDLGTVARDLAGSQGKQLDFRCAGLGIQADRHVLQQLREPLLHMIRNAVDHGIEPPAERRRKGKPEAGRLELELRVARDRLRTTLADDGAGVQLARVRERLLEMGLPAGRSDQDLLDRLFLPELTTAARPGQLSGRGVGLWVVEQVALRLQGRSFIAPRSPWGTLVGLETPLSVTAQSLLLVGCQEQVFGIPSHAILRLLRFFPEDLVTVAGEPTLPLPEGSASVAALAAALGMNEPAIASSEGRLYGAMVGSGERRVVLVVDRLAGYLDAEVVPLEIPGYSNARLSGAVLLEDDSVCLVVNPFRIVEELSREGFRSRPLATAPTLAPARPRTVLVVDDSITTRTLEKIILETHGYQVVVALDGEDALRQLSLHPIDLVIADIQMPGMDGFALLRAIKADPVHRALPVILLTSREDREDMQRGLELGAEAYLIKQRFDQESLLEAVRQII